MSFAGRCMDFVAAPRVMEERLMPARTVNIRARSAPSDRSACWQSSILNGRGMSYQYMRPWLERCRAAHSACRQQ